jgi:hypothetical protein
MTIIYRTTLLILAAILTVPALAGAAGTVQLPQTGQTTCFDVGGGGIPCPGTGQDGETLAGVAWQAGTRFIVNANTVTDNLTGLMWTRDANAPDPAGPAPAVQVCAPSRLDLTWQEALTYITCLNTHAYLGFGDWRLPNQNEIESLVNAGVANISTELTATAGFVNVQPSQYWSSTSDAGGPVFAWDVDFVAGDFPLSFDKDQLVAAGGGRAAWPVRGISTGGAGKAQLWRTGQTGCFDSLGNTRACAGTGEDGDELAGAAWPAPRFVANAGSTFAADRLTGLIWPTDTQTPGPGQATCAFTGLNVTWSSALLHVQCLNTNSYLGINTWRLPNRKELRSLIDYSQNGPALPAGHPFANIGVGGLFWTSTTDASNTARAWLVNLAEGSIIGQVKANAGNVFSALPVSGPDATVPIVTLNAVTSPTRLTALTVTGTVEAGITPQVTVNNGTPFAATMTGATTWSAPVTGMTEGVNNITATATDLAANVATDTKAITVNLPSGSFSGTGAVTVSDALKALRIAVNLVTATAAEMLHGDVSPLVNGIPAPDGLITVDDALVILKKAVGLVSF